MPEQTCRSCHAAIRWVKMAKTGKSNPLDAQATDKGNIDVRDDGLAYYLTGDALANARAAKLPLYISHFATCVNAAQHRKPRGTDATAK